MHTGIFQQMFPQKFTFYQYMRNFHYPKPVRCFRIGNPAMKTGYSIVTLKGKQVIAPHGKTDYTVSSVFLGFLSHPRLCVPAQERAAA
ncbi:MULTISPECIES: hypothetical protein [Eubacteriales]|uniref:hypothetical protein n=1 Tax=Clostridia TaxID=186801 RepID=UPI001A9ACD8E|nr:hypothetical protein [Clostridium sp. AM33-3]